MYDDKMIELGLVSDKQVAMEAYDSYIRNGLLSQLTRIQLGKDLTESHMQARKLISSYALENSDCIERVYQNNKTYFAIKDYEKLQKVFGNLLAIIQDIKSTGNYAKGKELVETYGVKIDPLLHKQVLERYQKLNLKPYGGFVNVDIVPMRNSAGEVIDYSLEYPESFLEQMLRYGREYSFDE